MAKRWTNQLAFSPDLNPLLQTAVIPTRKARIRSNLQESPLADASTGEIVAAATIHAIEEVDTQHFVKIFADGIAAAYDLNKTAHRTFCAILKEYERQPMTNGYAESINLSWFNDGLCGKAIGMSEKTFNRGMRDLLAKGFIAPRMPNTYWVNPALFFKGDRVLFVKEYRRKGLLQRADPKTITMSYTEK